MSSKAELKAFASEFYASFEELRQSYRESVLGQFRREAVMCRNFVSFLADLDTILNAEYDRKRKAETERIIAGLNLVRLQRLANLLIKAIAGNELPPKYALLSALSRGGFSCFISASGKPDFEQFQKYVYRLVRYVFGSEFCKQWPKGCAYYPVLSACSEGEDNVRTAIIEILSQMSLICALHSYKGRNTLALINHASLHFKACACMAKKHISDLTPSVSCEAETEYMKEMFSYMFNAYAVKSLEKLYLSLEDFNASESRTREKSLRQECATLREYEELLNRSAQDPAKKQEYIQNAKDTLKKIKEGTVKVPKRSTDYVKLHFAEPLYCVLMLKQVFNFIRDNRERIDRLDSTSGINEIWEWVPVMLSRDEDQEGLSLKDALKDWLKAHIYFFEKVSVSERVARWFVVSGDEFSYRILASRLRWAFLILEALRSHNSEVLKDFTDFLAV